MTRRPYPAETIPEPRLLALRLLASDVDDTLTRDGKMAPAILDAVERLRGAGLLIWLVTGRCAAWGQALAHYLPVDGVIAENGGVICRGEHLRLVADREALGAHRERLAAVYEQIRRRIPAAVETEDNVGRLTDWTFARPPLSDADLALAAQIAREAGLRLITSSIHAHLLAGAHDKASTLGLLCDELGVTNREQVLTLGDSLNDEPLFDEARFPFSAAVANVARYLDRLQHKPLFVIPHAQTDGALWLLRRLLVSRGL
jgi:HAD superfamily hydrolase (TIGR01484 family)